MNPKKNSINLGRVEVDWITATSFDHNFYKHWKKELSSWERKKDDVKLMQYLGESVELDNGTMRLLSGLQKGRNHYMLHLTGGLSQTYLTDVQNQYKQGFLTVKRMDVQITIKKPKAWSQLAFFEAMHGRSAVGWADSKDKRTGERTETVYIGSRKSDRFKRVYTKVSDSGMLLRFEVEFKGHRAQSAFKYASLKKRGLNEILLHELLSLKSSAAESAFYTEIDSDSPYRVRVIRDTSRDRTAAWLSETCLPSAVQYMSDSRADGEMWKTFVDSLMQVGRDKGYIED